MILLSMDSSHSPRSKFFEIFGGPPPPPPISDILIGPDSRGGHERSQGNCGVKYTLNQSLYCLIQGVVPLATHNPHIGTQRILHVFTAGESVRPTRRSLMSSLSDTRTQMHTYTDTFTHTDINNSKYNYWWCITRTRALNQINTRVRTCRYFRWYYSGNDGRKTINKPKNWKNNTAHIGYPEPYAIGKQLDLKIAVFLYFTWTELTQKASPFYSSFQFGKYFPSHSSLLCVSPTFCSGIWAGRPHPPPIPSHLWTCKKKGKKKTLATSMQTVINSHGLPEIPPPPPNETLIIAYLVTALGAGYPMHEC